MRGFAITCGLFLVAALLAAQPALTFQPPKLEPPDKDTTAAIEKRTAELGKTVERLRSLGVRDPNLADIEVFLDAARAIVKHNEFYKGGGKQTLDVLAQGLLRTSQAARGEAPWLTAPQGLTVARAYRSRLDGSVQPFAVSYPPDYGQDRRKRYHLHVELHGRSAGLTEVGFLARHNGKKTAAEQTFIQIDVFGRGNNAYRWAGEVDVFEAVENFFAVETALNRSNLLDASKVILRGFSMGGAGTWHIGLHRADQFCVLGPGAGFTTTHGYASKDRVPDKLPAYQESCLRIYDAVDYAENAFNVPVVAYSGEDDKQKKAADNIQQRLEKLGIPMQHLIAPKTEHTLTPEYRKKLLAEYAKQAERERDEYPAKIRFVTYTLKYPSCYWVDLLGLEKHYEQARVEASRMPDGFAVKTANVRGLRLGLWPGADRGEKTVTIDGQKLADIRPAQARTNELNIYLEKRSGKWAVALPERLAVDRLRTPQKSAGLQGPIDDAFTAPFLCVRGSGTAWHERTAAYVKADLARFRAEWSKFFRGTLPVKDDVDVTAEDIATRHLILFGDPGSNSLIAEALPRLPLKWTQKTITFAGKEYDAAAHVPVMIYPSPLAADRYVVLNSGHTFHEPEFTGTNALLFPRLGDHAILKISEDKKDALAVEVQTAGLFDDHWRQVGGASP